MKTILKTRRAH